MRKNNVLKKIAVIGMSAIMLYGQSMSVQAAVCTVGTPGFNRSSANNGLAYKRVVAGTTTSGDSNYLKTEVWCTYHVTGSSYIQETPGGMGYGLYAANATETTTYGTAYIFVQAKNEGSYRNSNYQYVSVGTKSRTIN